MLPWHSPGMRLTTKLTTVSETNVEHLGRKVHTIAAAAVVASVQVGDNRATIKQTQEVGVLLGAEASGGRVRVAAGPLAIGALSVQLLSGVADFRSRLGQGQSSGGKESGDGEELHCDS